MMIRGVVATTMRSDLVATERLSGGHAKGDDLGFSKIFAFPLNGWAISIRSNILEYEAQKSHNLRVKLCNQHMRTLMPLSPKGEPIELIELGDKFQQF